MQRVLVVERDRDLRESLETLLEEIGYVAAGTGDPQLAEGVLRVIEQPMVVLLGHSGPFEVASALLRRICILSAHTYILLSTRPPEAPVTWNPYTGRFVPILEIPCDLDVLVAAIDDAAPRIARAGTMEAQPGEAIAVAARRP